jgi:hypothetical protein
VRQIDPKLTFRVEALNGWKARESGLWLKASAAPGTGGAAIVTPIPKSWSPPHQVTYQNVFRFYAPDSNGKYMIDVDELRAVFSLSATVADKIRNFRIERAAGIEGGDTPVALLGCKALILHVVPFSAVGLNTTFPI